MSKIKKIITEEFIISNTAIYNYLFSIYPSHSFGKQLKFSEHADVLNWFTIIF